MNAIKRILQDYFSMGGDFQTMRFAAGIDAVKAENDIEQMDAEFNFQAGGEG